jgi:hypothetical protein
MNAVWYTFTAFVLLTYLVFGRTWLRSIRRWHIGAMSTSYTVLCLEISRRLANVEFHDGMATMTLIVAMVFGCIGLYGYWSSLGMVVYSWMRFHYERGRNGKPDSR